MDYLDELYGHLTSGDPALGAALAEGRPADIVRLSRLLRHTPLHVLTRNRSGLVDALQHVPHLHDVLRVTWSRQDAATTSLVFAWVEQARLREGRSSGRATTVVQWMQERELAAAA